MGKNSWLLLSAKIYEIVRNKMGETLGFALRHKKKQIKAEVNEKEEKRKK